MSIEQVKRSKIYDVTGPAQEILQDIDDIRQLDKEAEKKQSTGTLVIVIGLLVSILSGVAIALTEGASILPMISLPAGVATLIGGIVYRWTASTHNLTDRRYELVASTLDMLLRDSTENATFSVRIDFKSPTENFKFTHKDKIGPWSVKFYKDSWLSIRGKLIDGTAYCLQVDELTQHRGRWKTSRSGKNKYKQKTKSATVAGLQLKPKVEKYPQLESLKETGTSQIQLPPWCQLKKTDITANGIALKVGTKNEWNVAVDEESARGNDGAEMVAMMFLSLYRTLNESRQIRKRGGTS